MKRSKFSETQIVSMLKEHEAGMKVSEICRNHSISEATFYNWKEQVWRIGSERTQTDA